MNRIIFGTMAAFVAMALIMGTAGAQATGALSLQGLTISPTPVVAGESINVSFNLFNSYSQSLSQTTIQLESQNPIINVSPAYGSFIGTVGTGQYGGIVNNRFSYQLHIPSTLPTGEYEIDVVANYQTTEGAGGIAISAQSIMPIYIYIYGKPQVSLNLYPTTKILPGQDFTATLAAINSGTDTARNVSVEILNSTFFKPDGPDVFYYGVLSPGGSSSSTATIFTEQNVTAGQNYLKAKVAYTTDQGVNVSSVVNLPINILQNIAIFSISNVTGVIRAGSTYTPVSFRVKNTGNEQATDIEFSLQTVYPVTPVDPDVFVSSLGPSESTNITFYVSGNSNGNTGQYPITLYAQWTQPNGATNQQYSGSTNYYVPVKGQVGLFSAANEDYFIAIGVVVVILIALGVVRRLRKKGINSKRQK